MVMLLSKTDVSRSSKEITTEITAAAATATTRAQQQ